ncbi:MAG: T9SS type A sorting domain-containing protein [Bacteroidetes bacterium]|nr:T9SS type A sorting domain-containing protein [Bacteroidota bacterium]MBM3424173.1 T9SS type A sorting domain-containing protein [Bacteroidota bacterium]
MKPFLLLAGMMAGTLSAQITLDQNDMPSVGDNIPRKSDTMTVLPGPGGSGPNQTWNFTATSNYVVSENTSVVSVASTPSANQFGNSNMAMTNDNASYLYFNKSAQSFTTQGFSGDLLGSGIINAVFNPDLTLHQFPRTFGSSFNDLYVIDVIVPGAAINPLVSQIRFKRSSMVHDTTDAWGQITTPQGTYDVLRIYTTDNYTDSIWALPIFPPTWSLVSTSSGTTGSYSWVGKGGKLAIAEMSFDTLGAPKIFRWTELDGIGVGIEEEALPAVNIFPNPCTDHIIIENALPEQISLLNAYGQNVMVEKIATLTGTRLNLRNISNGLYFIETNKDQVKLKKHFIKE